MIIDDPIKPQDVSETTLSSCRRWWDETVPSRFGDQKNACRVLIMQRLHELDLAGVAIEQGYELLRLPMRFEPKACSYTKLGGDLRSTEGELLDPVRFPEEVVARLEKEMGSRTAAAQLQQRPAPEAGAIFQRKWFKHYKEPPARFESMLQSWDCSFKDTDGSDYVCGSLWGIQGGEFYLLDLFWEHADFPTTCAAVEAMTRKWPKAITKLIEDKANGTAVIQTLQKKISGIIEVQPEGGKESRANAVAPLFEAGNVWFPSLETTPWVDGLENEMATFPFAAHDDRVDSVTQALLYAHGKHVNLASAMAGARKIFGIK
jgi:predicted phage terminase large subunit-like protein